MSEYLKITDEYGNIPVSVPGAEIVYSDLDKRLYSCYGIKLVGPKREGVITPTMGTEEFAKSHVAEWKERLKGKGIEVQVVHIPKGGRFPFCSDWGGRREVYWTTHGNCPEK